MRPVAVAIFFQRSAEVLRMLALQLWHAVVRIGVLVAVDAMAAEAGVRECLTPLRVTLKRGLLGAHRSGGNAEADSRGDKHTRTHPGPKPLKRHRLTPNPRKTAPNVTV